MALWVDKHRPRQLSELDYHKSQAEQLKNLAQQSDFPHLMFFGPSGAGKKTRILCLLRELYGDGVEHIKNETFHFTTASNRKMEIMTIGSNYHLEINPSDAGIYDRIVVVELIKQIAQTRNLNQDGQREFKVIVLSEVDSLTKDAQHALRRTMEKYMATCRIILCVNSTSRVIPAIRSRCLGIRVSAPTIDEMVRILEVSMEFTLGILQNINLSNFFFRKHVKKKELPFHKSWLNALLCTLIEIYVVLFFCWKLRGLNSIHFRPIKRLSNWNGRFTYVKQQTRSCQTKRQRNWKKCVSACTSYSPRAFHQTQYSKL